MAGDPSSENSGSLRSSNVVRHSGGAEREQREKLLGQKGCTVWFTGLSGSGKSTIACALELRLVEKGRLAFVLDGDNVRHGLNGDLGFDPESRKENIRRVGEVAALFSDCGVITLVAFISPYREDRLNATKTVGKDRFLEVYVAAPLETCEKRDPKGLYQKARLGEITQFTGVDAPYEHPEQPDLCIQTHETSVESAVEALVSLLRKRGFLQS